MSLPFYHVWTSWDNFGQFWTILDNFEQFWTILDNFGQLCTSLDNFGQVHRSLDLWQHGWYYQLENFRKSWKPLAFISITLHNLKSEMLCILFQCIGNLCIKLKNYKACSPNPTTNVKTTNLSFNKYLVQSKQVWFVNLLSDFIVEK